jgi:phosphoglycolate phosphatase
MKLDNIIIDLEGTLVDSSEGILTSLKTALAEAGHPVSNSEQLRCHIGRSTIKTLFSLLGQQPALVEQTLLSYRRHYAENGIHQSRLYPGITEALETLHNLNFRLFVATLKPRLFARQILDQFHLLGHIEGIYGSEFKDRLADKRNLVGNLLYNEGLKASATLMLGDRSSDIIAGKKNGLSTIGVTYGFGRREELEEVNCDSICDSVNQWAQFLKYNRHPVYIHYTHP